MTTTTCSGCGFDASRWSDEDLERTLVHADELTAHVLEGADDDVIAAVPPVPAAVGDDRVASVHALMHHLDDVAAARRTRHAFEPMVGRVESLQASGGGVPKASIPSARLDAGGVVGDAQANRRHHGRPWQAVCLYSADLIAALRAEGHAIAAGRVGENITISGVDWSRLRGGLTITIGDVELRTSAPAAPCSKIGDCFDDRYWNRIDHVEHPGWARWYASVRTGGDIAPGDTVTITA